MSDIDVSKVVVTNQTYDEKTGEMVTKVTQVGPAVKDKKVDQVISRVKVDPPSEAVQSPDTKALEDRIKKLEKTIEELKSKPVTDVKQDTSSINP